MDDAAPTAMIAFIRDRLSVSERVSAYRRRLSKRDFLQSRHIEQQTPEIPKRLCEILLLRGGNNVGLMQIKADHRSKREHCARIAEERPKKWARVGHI